MQPTRQGGVLDLHHMKGRSTIYNREASEAIKSRCLPAKTPYIAAAIRTLALLRFLGATNQNVRAILSSNGAL